MLSKSTDLKCMVRSFLIAMALWGLAFVGGYWSISSLPPQSPPMGISQGNLLVNNLFVLLVTLSGLLTAGLASILEMLMNGIFAGAMTKSFVLSGLSIRQVVAMSWLHGSTELVGFWLAAGVGLEGVGLAWKFLHGRRTDFPVRRVVLGAGVAFLLIVLAALIEVNVSLPKALQQYTRDDGGAMFEQGQGVKRSGDGVDDWTTVDCGPSE
jgi:uncharacterized membrane protein SpoIIM required for sporulation